MAQSAANSETGEDLLVCTFLLGSDGIFGIEAPLIQEVVMKGEITPVRHAPAFVAGIRNLRGRIISVIDLSVRLGLGAVRPTPENRVLIADCKGEPVGLMVDSVADAIALNPGELERAPANVQGAQMQELRGVFRNGERLVALLDLATVLGSDDRSGKTLTDEECSGR